LSWGKPLRIQIPHDVGESLRRAPASMDTNLPAKQFGSLRSRTQANPELALVTRPVLYHGRLLPGRWSDGWSRAFAREAQITCHRSLPLEGYGAHAAPKTCERRLFCRCVAASCDAISNGWAFVSYAGMLSCLSIERKNPRHCWRKKENPGVLPHLDAGDGSAATVQIKGNVANIPGRIAWN